MRISLLIKRHRKLSTGQMQHIQIFFGYFLKILGQGINFTYKKKLVHTSESNTQSISKISSGTNQQQSTCWVYWRTNRDLRTWYKGDKGEAFLIEVNIDGLLIFTHLDSSISFNLSSIYHGDRIDKKLILTYKRYIDWKEKLLILLIKYKSESGWVEQVFNWVNFWRLWEFWTSQMRIPKT